MGAAKQRGTFEERRESAIERDARETEFQKKYALAREALQRQMMRDMLAPPAKRSPGEIS